MPLLPDGFDQHPLPAPAVKIHGPATPPGLKRSAPKCQNQAGRWSLPRPPHGSSRATLRVAFHLRCASALLPCSSRDRGLPEASSAGAVVQPASGPASSLMNTLAVMRIADTRINAFLVVYDSHTPDGRGHCGDRPRPEQPQLNPSSTTTVVLRTRLGLTQDQEKDWLM